MLYTSNIYNKYRLGEKVYMHLKQMKEPVSKTEHVVITSCFLWENELVMAQFPMVEIIPSFFLKLAFNIM